MAGSGLFRELVADIGGADGSPLCALIGQDLERRGIVYDLPQAERTQAEFTDLPGTAGFTVERILPTSGLFSIIEATGAA